MEPPRRFLVALGGMFVLAAIVFVPPPVRSAAGAMIYAPEHVYMVITAGGHRGPDHRLHDSYTPADFSTRAGQKLVITVYNYDLGQHSFDIGVLRVHAVIAAATTEGVPKMTTFSFTVHKAGIYHWRCFVPCDDVAHGWAMIHDGYMSGTVFATPE